MTHFNDYAAYVAVILKLMGKKNGSFIFKIRNYDCGLNFLVMAPCERYFIQLHSIYS